MTGPSLLIAGCGYLGLRVCREASARGWKVWGLRRNPEAAGLIREAGGEAIIADLTDPRALTGRSSNRSSTPGWPGRRVSLFLPRDPPVPARSGFPTGKSRPWGTLLNTTITSPVSLKL